MRIPLLIAFFFLSYGSAGLAFAEPELQFSNAWVRQAPPASKYRAGYGEFKNTSRHEIKIVAIQSAFFKKVQMHISEFDRGMMKMTEVKSLTLKAGESVLFKPNGRHFMLVNPLTAIQTGGSVPVTVKLNNGNEYHFAMTVRR